MVVAHAECKLDDLVNCLTFFFDFNRWIRTSPMILTPTSPPLAVSPQHQSQLSSTKPITNVQVQSGGHNVQSGGYIDNPHHHLVHEYEAKLNAVTVQLRMAEMTNKVLVEEVTRMSHMLHLVSTPTSDDSSTEYDGDFTTTGHETVACKCPISLHTPYPLTPHCTASFNIKCGVS